MIPLTYPSILDAYSTPVSTTEQVILHSFKWGMKFWIQEKSQLFKQIKDRKTPYQSKNNNLLKNCLTDRPTRRIIDVGLNIGMMSAQYSDWAQTVSGFEPTPKLQEMALKNLVLNNKSHNVEVYNTAIADRVGEMNFADIHDNGAINRLSSDTAHLMKNRKSSTSFRVPVTTIDSFGWNDVDAIKIDTEGSEFLVVMGAEDTIMRCQPIVQVELMTMTLHKWHHHPQDVFDWFYSRGYQATNLSHTILHDKWEYNKEYSDIFFFPKDRVPSILKTYMFNSSFAYV